MERLKRYRSRDVQVSSSTSCLLLASKEDDIVEIKVTLYG